MRIIILSLLICSTFLFSQTNKSSNKVVATVGTTKIYISDWGNRYEKYLFSTGMSDKFYVRERYLKDMIDEVVLKDYDDNSEILQNKEYQLEVKWLKKQAVLAYLKDQEVYAKLKVSDEEARKTFLQMNQEIAVRHLFAETKSEADNLYRRLQLGFTFNELAKQVFTDSILANNGGYLGYHTWGDFDPAFEEVAFNLKVGEISKPVKTEYGYSIIRVDDKKTKPLLTEHEYQLKKKQIIRSVKINLKKSATEKYIKGLVDFSKIKFNEKCLKLIFEKYQTDSLKKIEINENKFSAENCIFYRNKKYSNLWLLNKLGELPAFQSRKITDLTKLETIIKGIVLQNKLLKIAHKKGYDKDKIVLDTYKKQMTQLFMTYKKLVVLKELKLPDSTVYTYYLNHKDFFSTHNNLNVQEIIIKKITLADSLIKILTNGADFGKLAKQYSIRKITAKKNGVVGFVSLEKFGKLKEKFWSLAVGELFGPVEMNGYYGIFKILGKKPSKPLKFRQIKSDVEVAAKYSFQKPYFQNYIDRIRKRVKININKVVLSSKKIQTYGVH